MDIETICALLGSTVSPNDIYTYKKYISKVMDDLASLIND